MTKKNSPSTPLPFSNKDRFEIWLIDEKGLTMKILKKKRIRFKKEIDVDSIYLQAIDRKEMAKPLLFLKREE